MKYILTFILTCFSINTFSQIAPTQIDTSKLVQYKANSKEFIDTSFKIIYANKSKNTNSIAYFLNDRLVDLSLFGSINPNNLEKPEFIKNSIRIENIFYETQFKIHTKANFNVKIVTLTELKKKYVAQKDKSVIFTIDGEIIDYDYDNYQIDENNLLTVIVDSFVNRKENIDLTWIKLLTRSPKNLNDRAKILIK
jgi:hypothetical protein